MRVLQLNIWARYGPYETREPRLKRLFAELRPDLIAMEEVDAGRSGESQAHELLDGLGYDVKWERRGDEEGGGPGIAVASRHRILDRQVHQLGRQGVALAIRVDLGDEAMWFSAVTTMSWTPGLEAEREEKVVELDRWLGELAAEDSIPPVIGGDFDATPDTSSIRFLSGLQGLGGRSTFWADAFAHGGDGSPGYTFTSDSPYVQPFMEAVFAQPVHHRRIDYVFVGSPIRWTPRLVVTSARVVGQYADGGAPSDHYGVLAELELDGDRVGGGRGLEGWPDAERDLWG
ncbi:MAG: endonuclease/exonuclease/phosphatase family protein [Chloroflexota bacterium]|nr:endonuclease/exonuclease/phosphatase family protein [Chloroflexota bacterium]